MILTKMQLDEEHEIEFEMSVFGTSEKTSDVRFVIESNDFDVVVHGAYENGHVKVKIPKLKGVLDAGEHACRMEAIIDGKIFTPLNESIEFEPLVELDVKKAKKDIIKETVTVSPVKVTSLSTKSSKIDEVKSQGFEIVDSMGYKFMLKEGMYYGVVTEDKVVTAHTPQSTIEDLVAIL